MKIVWGAILAVAFSASALAQEPDADMHAKADAMIALAEAGDLFTNITTDDGMAVVRHNATGLECISLPPHKARIGVLTVTKPRGDDVFCETAGGGLTISFYATREPSATVKSEMRMATAAIRYRWPKARNHKPKGDSGKLIPRLAEPSPIPDGTTWFKVTSEDGQPLVTRLSVATAGEWVIKMRATGAAFDPGLELLTDMLWHDTVRDVSQPKT